MVANLQHGGHKGHGQPVCGEYGKLRKGQGAEQQKGQGAERRIASQAGSRAAEWSREGDGSSTQGNGTGSSLWHTCQKLCPPLASTSLSLMYPHVTLQVRV